MDMDFTAEPQEAPMGLLSRLSGSVFRSVARVCPSRSLGPCGCDGVGGRCMARESFADHLWAPLKTVAFAPQTSVLGVLAAYAAYCACWALWAPVAFLVTEYGAWALVVYGVRRGGHCIARFATFPGSFATATAGAATSGALL